MLLWDLVEVLDGRAEEGRGGAARATALRVPKCVATATVDAEAGGIECGCAADWRAGRWAEAVQCR